jgi:hypothetical protein
MLALTAALAFADVSFFTERALFVPALANPRSPEIGMEMRLTTPFDNFTATAGARLPLITLGVGRHAFQIGLDGCVWTALSRTPNGIYFPVSTVDYQITVPIMWRSGDWSAEVMLSHISAHRADGFTGPYPLAPDGQPRGAFKYSREFVQAELSRDMRAGDFQLRAYAMIGYIVRVAPADLQRGMAGGGWEVTGPLLRRAVRPYGAVDATWNQDTGTVDVSGQLGLWLAPSPHAIVQTRIALGFYSGSDRRGQEVGEARERFGLGFYFRFTDPPH